MAPRWTFLCAGLWMLLGLGRGHFTEEDQQLIVNRHNHHRSMVQPQAADMIRMKWATELALVAKEYATQCIWEHNPESKNVMGENLFITTGPLDIEKALNDWFKEHEDYSYDNNTCSEDKMCGHYTQMVWANSKNVGCGSHICETVEGLDFKDATIMVCNYLPPGNYIGRKPYEAGEQCTKCPENLQDCIERACDKTDGDELTSLKPTEQGVTDMPQNVSESDVTLLFNSDGDELTSLEPTEQGVTDMPQNVSESDVTLLFNSDGDELTSLEPTEQGVTDMPQNVSESDVTLLFNSDELTSLEPTEQGVTDMPQNVSESDVTLLFDSDGDELTSLEPTEQGVTDMPQNVSESDVTLLFNSDGDELTSLEPTEQGVTDMPQNVSESDVTLLFNSDGDELTSLEPTEQGVTDMPHSVSESDVTLLFNSDRDELPSVEPTELWITDMPHTVSAEMSESGSGRPSAVSLLLTAGLLASIFLL